MAEQAVEVGGAAAVEVGGVGDALARAPVVAGVGVAGAVGGALALWPREGGGAEAAGAQVTRHARAAVPAVEAAAGARVVLAGGAGVALEVTARGSEVRYEQGSEGVLKKRLCFGILDGSRRSPLYSPVDTCR